VTTRIEAVPQLRDDPATSTRPAPPCAFVVFGASGDLTHRKLVPALYQLAARGLSTTVADARRQLILKTFAAAGGDLTRTSKMAGVSVDEVRAELMLLLEAAPSNNGSVSVDGEARIARKPDNIAAARGAAKGKPPKKK